MENTPDIFFEYEYVRVVYEFILSKIRINKKLIEKDLNTIVLKLSQIKKKLISDAKDKEKDKKISPDIVKVLETMTKKILELENKIKSLKEEEDSLLNCLLERFKQIKLLDFNSDAGGVGLSSLEISQRVKNFCDKKMNNLILEFLLREKFLITAECLIKEEAIKESIEMSIYDEIQKILLSVKKRSLTEALAWANQNKSKLSKINSNIKFIILKQQFVELIKASVGLGEASFTTLEEDLRKRKESKISNFDEGNNERKNYANPKSLKECIKFAKENFNFEELETNEIKEIENIMLLFSINWKKVNKYKKLNYIISEERWNDLEKEIKKSFFSIYSMKPFSSLESLFQCGLMALKTSQCKINDKRKKVEYDNNCPTCDNEIGELAKNLPYSQHTISSLLCRKTKKVMDHLNLPLATKTGLLYSTNYITEQLKQNNNKFMCVEEKRNYKLDELKKVYLV